MTEEEKMLEAHIQDQKDRERREKHIGEFEIRCYNCGKIIRYTNNVPQKVTCPDCRCQSFRYEMVLPHRH